MEKLLDLSAPIFIAGDNSKVENIQPLNGSDFTLKELYNILQCDIIQVVPLYDGTIMIIDEEGKLKNDAVPNRLATQLYSIDRMNEERIKE